MKIKMFVVRHEIPGKLKSTFRVIFDSVECVVDVPNFRSGYAMDSNGQATMASKTDVD